MTSTPVESDSYPVLDTLRLVGALAVLTTHVAFWTGTYGEQPILGPFLARLDVGVPVFFVLSGFLLSRKWISASADRAPAPDVRRYLWRRLLRIYPLYVVTALLAVYFVSDNADMSTSDVLVTVAMLGIYVDPALPAGLSHTWSLATEVSFYLFLPLLMALGLGRGRRGLPVRRLLVLVLGMLVLSIAWLTGLAQQLPGTDDVPVNEWLPAFGGWFGAGILLALADVLLRRGEAPPWLRRTAEAVGQQPGACWVLVLGLLLVATTPLAGPTLLVPPTEAEALTKSLLYLLVGVVVVATGVFARPGTTYHRVMSAPLPRHLGRTSYAVFCIHLPVLHMVGWLTDYPLFTGNMLGIWLATLALTLVAAEFLYRFVEVPFMRFKDRGPGSREKRSAAAPRETRSARARVRSTK